MPRRAGTTPHPLQAVQRFGVEIEIIPEASIPAAASAAGAGIQRPLRRRRQDDEGDIDTAELRRMLARGPSPPRLVAITHVPTSSGRVYDAAAVGRAAKEAGVPYLLDACQSVGQARARRQPAVDCPFPSVLERRA